VHKLLVVIGWDGEDLASQPTLSRFETSVGRKELYRMDGALADTVIERQGKRLRGRPRLITLDLDLIDDPCTPQKPGHSLLFACSSCRCFLLIDIRYADRPEQMSLPFGDHTEFADLKFPAPEMPADLAKNRGLHPTYTARPSRPFDELTLRPEQICNVDVVNKRDFAISSSFIARVTWTQGSSGWSFLAIAPRGA
jgi:hypothetical protein